MRSIVALVGLAVAAWWVAACGSGPEDTPDAGGPDGAIPGAVTVTTLLPDPPYGIASGVDVVAIDPDGTSRATVTDDAGSASVSVAPGGSVAALYQGEHGPTVQMVLGAEPGDSLTFGYPPAGPDHGTDLGTMTVDAPTVAGATHYVVLSSCARGDASLPPVTLTVYADCPATDDLVVYASNGNAFDGLLGYAVLPAEAIADGGSATVGAWQTPSSLSLSVDDLPPDALNYFFLAAAYVGSDPGGSILTGTGDLPTSGASATTTLHWAPIGDSSQVLLWTNSFDGQAEIVDPIAPDATSHEFAMNGIPWITDVSLDLDTSTMRVTVGGDYAFDRTDLTFNARMSDGLPVRWELTAPPATTAGETAVTFPTLPEPFTSLNPASLFDPSISRPGATLTDYVSIDGYADARARPTEAQIQAGVRWVSN
jgi:hypothetical protein